MSTESTPPAPRLTPSPAAAPEASPRKQVVERYMDGFRTSDHARILACLTDDVVWELPGYKTLSGKEAFDREIEMVNLT